MVQEEIFASSFAAAAYLKSIEFPKDNKVCTKKWSTFKKLLTDCETNCGLAEARSIFRWKMISYLCPKLPKF